MLKKLISKMKKNYVRIIGLVVTLVISTETVFAVSMDQAVDTFLSKLEGPAQTGAGLVFVYGVFSLVMAIKEDNPQSKSSAIKTMIAGGVLYTVASNLSSLV